MTGVVQAVSGSDAEAIIANEGSIDLSAVALATGEGRARAVATKIGFVQFATAIETSLRETLHTGGTLTLQFDFIPEGEAP